MHVLFLAIGDFNADTGNEILAMACILRHEFGALFIGSHFVCSTRFRRVVSALPCDSGRKNTE